MTRVERGRLRVWWTHARDRVWIMVAAVLACTVATVTATSVVDVSGATVRTLPRAAAGGVHQPVVSCASLGSVDLSSVGAQMASATNSTQNGVDFCEVTGYISPQTQFTVLLPESTWRGEYLQQGCGGYCGHNDVSLQDPARTSGYQTFAPLADGEFVVAADDQGHEGPGGLWGKEDPMLRVVFGYRSEDDLARTAKTIIRAYYGRGPAYSYFDGVSDGGHEALALAQRYPTDFDGILVGAPANNWAALNGMYQPWLVRANMDANGRQILDSSKLPALHAAVMRACANANGMIADPRSCTFDPATLMCPSGVDRPDCLTPAQVTAVRRLYRGPTSHGLNLYDGGEPYGSELAWQGWMVGPPADSAFPNDTIASSIGLDYYRYQAFWHNAPVSFTLRDVSFTVDAYQRLQPLGRIYNATDPDLSAFRAHGGKLILYHGWADQAISPWTSLDYYSALARRMGGYRAAQRFSRLYMIPGLYHCPCGPYGTGDPASTIDLMAALVAWVEHGTAPAAVTFPVSGQSTGTQITSLTVQPFDPLSPPPHNNGLNSNYHYIGIDTEYRSGRALWCRQEGSRLVCTGAAGAATNRTDTRSSQTGKNRQPKRRR
jgi:Tannase and feruloyl esterase